LLELMYPRKQLTHGWYLVLKSVLLRKCSVYDSIFIEFVITVCIGGSV
jgi:hypothetical protein